MRATHEALVVKVVPYSFAEGQSVRPDGGGPCMSVLPLLVWGVFLSSV